MKANPKLVPGFVEIAELEKDRALRNPHNSIVCELDSLTSAVDETATLVGHKIYVAELAFTRTGAKPPRAACPAHRPSTTT